MLRLALIACVLIGGVNLSDTNFYEILGISKHATAQEIRQAYKKLAIKYHPDKNQNTSDQEIFIRITEAYETLKDPEKRRNYDIYGSYKSYSRKYDYKSQSEYDNLYYNGLYHNDPFVETLSGASFYNYLKDGFHFINFYSPFCPPCQNVADSWKKLAEIYKGIVKVGAVNCKYHNSFCYNSMRIGSYPTLLFYPNGKNGNFIYYRGDRTLEALDEFVIAHLRSRVHIPTVAQVKTTEKPFAYVLGSNRIDGKALTRIAYQLTGLVSVVLVEDDDIREKLTSDQYTAVVFRYKSTNKEIHSLDEKEIVKEIIDALPKIKQISPEDLKTIRIDLRSSSKIPWVFYFSSKGDDKLQLHQLKMTIPHLNFGEIDCDKYTDLCASLHVDQPPAWGVLKRGGAYQRAYTTNIRDFVQTASLADRLHTLSTSDFTRILDGDTGVWVLLVAPYQVPWDNMAEPFTQASLQFTDNDDISFGILSCTLTTDRYCRQVANNQPVIRVQNGTKHYTFNGHVNHNSILEFVNLLRDSGDMELNEQQMYDIMDPSREYTWLVAFVPQCGTFCEQIIYEWMLVASKLRALAWVKVGLLRCGTTGICTNVRSPTARLYPIAFPHHYSVSLQHLSEAPYMLEWALEYIDDSVQKLNWQSFSKNVIAEELNPSSGRKPWLVYYHSPRCYRCYEMYADFAIAGIFLKNAVNLGKVNCISERGLCQHEQITSYPTLRLYLNRNHRQQFSSIVTLQLGDHVALQRDIRAHLAKYDHSLLNNIDIGVSKEFLRDEL